MRPSFKKFTLFVIALAVVCISLAACSKKDPAATQAVATVDGEEISVHQINQVLLRAQGVNAENLPKVKLEILESLINQQLAINLAVSKKLDRSPDVVTAIENAKREIIARAAIEQISTGVSQPSDEEAKKYFAEHPALFSERRLFSLQEIALPKTTKDITSIGDKATSVKSMEEMSAWLQEKKIQFSGTGDTRAAEQIPLEILPKLHQFKDGQIGMIEGKDAYVIMRLVASQSQPVTEAQALPRIKVFLFNQRATEAVKQEREQMKAKAKIEYLGEFAGGQAVYKARIEAQVNAKARQAEQAVQKAKADEEALTEQKAADQAEAQAQAEARSKARSEARMPSGNASKTPYALPSSVDLEKGLKGLQ
jgi:EpsD family peptidyl-prolyl cis-trans isomerase